MSRSREKFAIFFYFFVVLVLAIEVGASPPRAPLHRKQPSRRKPSNGLYTRYVRHRDPIYPDDVSMEEVVEHFYTRQRPPQFFISDHQIDLMIRCDFEPHLEECEELKKADELAKPPVLPPLPPSAIETTPRPTAKPWYYPPPRPTLTPKRATSTTTTPAITTTTTQITTTSDLPFLPELDGEDEESDDYEEEEEYAEEDVGDELEEKDIGTVFEENNNNWTEANNEESNDIWDPEDGDDFK